MKLVDLLTSVHAADGAAVWSSLKQKKKRGAADDPQSVSVRQAIVKMVNDSDHMMRMYMARAVTNLFTTAKSGVHANQMSESRSCDTIPLLSCAGQAETFQQIFDMLHLAFVIPNNGLDELSAEDESVNRVASRIYTLLLCGCISPVCERRVVGELIKAMGRGLDADLVAKVGSCACVLH